MLGTTELLVILLIIIVVFGSTKLPQLGDALGKSIKNFKSAVKDGDKEEDKEEDGDKEEKKQDSGTKESSTDKNDKTEG